MKNITIIILSYLILFSAFGQALRTGDYDIIIPNNSAGTSVLISPKLSIGSATVEVNDILDEDDMSSDSADVLATQQSIKAYVDAQPSTLQEVYNASTDGEIILDGTINGIRVEDNATPITQDLFSVVQNAAASIFFRVTASLVDIFDLTFSGSDISSTSDITLTPSAKVTVDGDLDSGGVFRYLKNTFYKVLGLTDSDLYHTEDFEGSLDNTDFTCGNNATVLGGGTLDGALSIETSSPINGLNSLKYVMGSTSVNDYCMSPAITLSSKQKDGTSYISFWFTYTGDKDDIKFIVYDVANTAVLTTSLDLLTSESNAKKYHTQVPVPSTATTLRYGFQVSTGNSAKILVIDDIEFSTKPGFLKGNLTDSETIEYTGSTSKDGSSRLLYSTERFNTSRDILTVTNSGFTKYIFLRDATFIASSAVSGSGNDSTNFSIGHYDSGDTSIKVNFSSYNTTEQTTVTINGHASAGDYIQTSASGGSTDNNLNSFSITAYANSEYIVTPVKSNVTKWIAYTPSATQGLGTPTFDLEYRENVDSIDIRGVVDPDGTTGVEAQIALPNGWTVRDDLSLQVAGVYFIQGGATRNGGTALITGGDTYFNFGADSTFGSAVAVDSVAPSNGNDGASPEQPKYFHITGIPIEEFKNRDSITFLAAIPSQKVLNFHPTASEVYESFSGSTSYVTAAINRIDGDTEFASLASNRLTLKKGKYLLSAGLGVKDGTDQLTVAIYNFTDSSNIIERQIGVSTTTGNSFFSTLQHSFTLSKDTAIEIRAKSAVATGTIYNIGGTIEKLDW